jgi:CIC family chloride channel protein
MLIKALLGASILLFLILYFRHFFGEGYESIKVLSENNPGKILENTLLAISK